MAIKCRVCGEVNADNERACTLCSYTLEDAVAARDELLDSNYLGRAGESLIEAHLDNEHYDVAKPTVDLIGVDLIGHKRGVYVNIQVKTTRSNRMNLRFSPAQLEDIFGRNINIVAVFWPKGETPAWVLIPPSVTCEIMYKIPSMEAHEVDPTGPKAVFRRTMTIRRVDDSFKMTNTCGLPRYMVGTLQKLETFEGAPYDGAEDGMFFQYAMDMPRRCLQFDSEKDEADRVRDREQTFAEIRKSRLPEIRKALLAMQRKPRHK